MLNAEAVRVALRDGGSAFSTLHYAAETESTNDDAAAHLADDGSLGVVFAAEHQSRGRGRRGRTWIAPPGSALLVTAILPRPLPTAVLWAVPFWTALCAADAIQDVTGVRCALQWPNDLLLGQHKVCGILGISRVSGGMADVACGIGVNVQRPSEYDAELAAIDPPPAFLSDEDPVLVDPYTKTREHLLVRLLYRYEHALEALLDARDVARNWERRASLAGTPYRIRLDGEVDAFEATALALGNDGSLLVDRAGERITVAQADAQVLR